MQKQGLEGKKLKKYLVIRKLGEGTYSQVYEAVNTQNKQRVAIKAIPWKQINRKPKLKQLVETEIKVLRQCKSQNVIKHIDSFKSDKYVFIVTEFCNEGDMQKFLDKRGRLSQEEATDVLKQILNGFKGLHEVKAMHRDFKLANLLVHNKVVKIADLGFAKQLEKEQSLTTTQLGTGVTMAPEVLDGKEYGMYADIWSIGIVYYQMLHGVYPFNGQSDVEIRRKIERRIIPYSKSIKISDNARDFIQRCLIIDPKLRISWSEIYSHPLISKQNKMIYSLTVSKEKMQENKAYYMKNDIEAEKKFIYPERQEFLTVGGSEMAEIKADELKEEDNFEMIKKENQAKKKREAESFEYQQILLKKRNNIMFMFKFFLPKIAPYIDKISAIHSIALFMVCKKTIIQMQELIEQINTKKSAIKGNDKSVLSAFFQSATGLKFLNLLCEDIDMIKQQSLAYALDIRNSSPQIEIQLVDITKWQNPKIQALLNEVFSSYWYQIAQNVEALRKTSKYSPEIETVFIQALKALQFYWSTDEVDVGVFDLMLETLDYGEYRDEIVRKVYDVMVEVK